MKTSFKVIALALTAVCALGVGACTGTGLGGAGCANGCAGNQTVPALNSNWYLNTGFSGIQPATVGEANKERLVYSVSLKSGSAGNEYYSVSYDAGCTMTTEFYADTYDWTKSDIPEAYRATTATSETVYVYKINYTLSGKYIFTANKQEVPFTDSLTSVCYFRSVARDLTPLYSEQTTVSTAPKSEKPASAQEMTQTTSYTAKVYYNMAAKKVTNVFTDNVTAETKTTEGSFSGSLKVDNASLYTAIRAMKLGSASRSVNVFIPLENRTTTYTVSGSSKNKLDDAQIREALVNANYVENFQKDENGETKVDDKGSPIHTDIEYYQATVQGTGELKGGKQTVWYAATGGTFNTLRATMLKISVPVPFSLGTLEFKLKSVESHFDI